MDNNVTKLHETENSEPVNILLIGLYKDTAEENECLKSLAELRLLAETSVGDSAAESSFYTLTQCRPSPDPATFIGYGKAVEAKEICAGNNVSLVVVDSELSPSQIRNLENEINSNKANDVRVIDRTMLILDIFAKHAVTGEGKLQVEIAQLKYTAPRLTGKGTALSRQGGTSGSIGARGPGETKLETDKRHIARRLLALKKELSEIEGNRAVKRTKRNKSTIPSAVIAGYTNAGKSTLLNYLTDAGILEKDMLFATLDPTVRKLVLPSGRTILLSDTVGFISRLPHQLVESFKSTLEEVKDADIVLVVADASDTDVSKKISVTEQILSDMDAGGKPVIYVYNKCDRLDILPPRETLSRHDSVCISAKDGTNVESLLERIDKILSETKKTVNFLFPFEMQSAVNDLYRNAAVNSVEYTESGALVNALVDEKCYGMYKKYIVEEGQK